MIKVYPAILTDSIAEVQTQLDQVKNNSRVEVVHIDIIDGYFTDNLTITPMDLVEVDLGRLKLDFHLMTEEPLSFAEEIVNYREFLAPKTVIGQVEKMTSQNDFVDLLLERELRAGLSLNLYTPHEEILESVFKKLSVLQLMAIEAGEQGKQFNQNIFAKLEEVQARAKKSNPDLEIIMDGGVKLENINEIKKRHISGVVVGSVLWQSENIGKTLERLCQ